MRYRVRYRSSGPPGNLNVSSAVIVTYNSALSHLLVSFLPHTPNLNLTSTNSSSEVKQRQDVEAATEEYA